MDRIRVAHVGHVDHAEDHARWLAVADWLRANDRSLYGLVRRCEAGGGLEHHFIDLNRTPRRDFLAERDPYELVITHNLWGLDNARHVVSGGTAQSVHHSRDSWSQRLAETGARYIFLAGNAFNLAYLDGEVPGYRQVDFCGLWYMNVLQFCPAPSTAASELTSQPLP